MEKAWELGLKGGRGLRAAVYAESGKAEPMKRKKKRKLGRERRQNKQDLSGIKPQKKIGKKRGVAVP
jgi:hypothetical protein